MPRLSCAVVLLAGSVLSACVAPEGVGGAEAPLINGDVASNQYTGVGQLWDGGCSAVLIAPRVMLTSAHCVRDYALQCMSVASGPFSVRFAETGGGWSSQASFDGRTVEVQALVQRPELFDLSQCSSSDAYDCSDSQRESVDHSKELVVLYLADEAPADALPLPVMVSPGVDMSDAAGEFATYGGLTSWVGSDQPLVTTVGYGVGSHGYTIGGDVYRGRDFGIQRWISTTTTFAGYLGSDCDSLNPTSSQPGVVVSPDDLTPSQVGDPDDVTPGQSFAGADHSHSGGGDSGGPVLVGAGASANGVSPDPLPSPAAGSYDPARNYVVGTASLWVGSGSDFATAFTPTWTPGATQFLAGALHDLDGDDYADPVDDDVDGDQCDNDVDQHPWDASVPIGTVLHIMCNPSSSPWYGDEGIDTDGDTVLNCEDEDDDGDHIDDEFDACPVHSNQICFRLGAVCPWNPVFFDCRLAGCFDFLVRLSSVINPDPTRELLLPVRSSSAYEVVVGPVRGMTLEQTAAALTAGGRTEVLRLEMVVSGRTRGTIAAYAPSTVSVGSLRGASALMLRFSRDGQLAEILGR